MVTREDALVMASKFAEKPASVDALLDSAQKVYEWLNPEVEESVHADVIGERDRARDTAVRLEQELAESDRQLAEVREQLRVEQERGEVAKYDLQQSMTKDTAERKHLIRGVLLQVKGYPTVTSDVGAILTRAVNRAAEKFGVEL